MPELDPAIPDPTVVTIAGIPVDGSPGASVEPLSRDRSFALSLRLLTGLVIVGIAGSVSLLGYRWAAPRFASGDAGRKPVVANAPAPAPASSDEGPAAEGKVLMDPGRVFTCVEQGHVTFTDQNISDKDCKYGSSKSGAAAPAAEKPPAAVSGAN